MLLGLKLKGFGPWALNLEPQTLNAGLGLKPGFWGLGVGKLKFSTQGVGKGPSPDPPDLKKRALEQKSLLGFRAV